MFYSLWVVRHLSVKGIFQYRKTTGKNEIQSRLLVTPIITGSVHGCFLGGPTCICYGSCLAAAVGGLIASAVILPLLRLTSNGKPPSWMTAYVSISGMCANLCAPCP